MIIDYLGGPYMQSQVFYKEGRGRLEERKRRRPCDVAKSVHGPADLGEGERGHEPRNARN